MLSRVSVAARRVLACFRRQSQGQELVEEENVKACTHLGWYPVVIGEVFLDRYEVLGKLGWGQTSTIWLCKDLE